MCATEILRLTRYRRWVVDWTDHVWIEVKVDGIWAHIDPCEAVFEEKMMYAGWGKQHTYIVAFSKVRSD